MERVHRMRGNTGSARTTAIGMTIPLTLTLTGREVFLLVLILLFLFSSCRTAAGARADRGDVLDRLTGADAVFTAAFDSALTGNGAPGLSVVCAAKKTGGEIVLTVKSPERSAGIVIRCAPAAGRCTIGIPGSDRMPVDPQAAASLLSLFAGLCGAVGPDASDGFPAWKRSDSGELTEIGFPGGDGLYPSALILSEGGVPLGARSVGPDGSPREMRIEGYEPAGE